MSFVATVIQVLIASPADLAEERKVAIEAVYEWNAQHANAESVVLLPVAWETHAVPSSGVRPQEAINQQLVDQSDFLVGMFWTKLGTSTGLAASGTVEEIDRFIAASKPAQLYFSSRPIDPGKIDQKQHRRLKAFKETTYKNALVGSFDSLDSLRQIISRNLLSEVRSLKLKSARGAASLAPVTASATPAKGIEDEADPSITPDESWDRDDFERAIYFAVRKTDDAQIKLIDEAYRKADSYSEKDNASTWQAFVEWTRIMFGKGGQLKRLQKLAENNPDSDQTNFYLGIAYRQYDQHQLAANAFFCSMRAAESLSRKALCASNAISEFHKAKNRQKLDEALGELRKLLDGSTSLEAILTETVQEIVEAEKDESFSIALLERQIELSPDDHETRFRLAFKQSQAGNEAIALHHYYKIPFGERSSMTWNNIGAAADQLGLPAKSVAAYKRAAAMDETLAMSNLGNKLMNVGFLELAREQCDTAVAKKKPHANVGHLLTSLATVEEDEQSRQTDLLNAIENQVSHLRRLGRAATLQTSDDIAENWQGPDCTLKLVRKGDRLTLNGTYEFQYGLLASLFAPANTVGVAGALPVPKSKYSITYSGQIRGRAVIGDVKRERAGETLLGSAGEKKMSMIFSDDGDEISVFEEVDSKEPSVHVLKRVELLGPPSES